MSKKAYLRTVEAMVAVVLTFLFIMFAIPSHSLFASKDPNLDLMTLMGQNPDFRNCAIADDYPCLYSIVNDFSPILNRTHVYIINISMDPNTAIDLPETDVYVDSVFIAGNETQFYPKVVRIYSWAR